MKRLLLWLIGVVAVLLAIAAFGFRIWFHAFLESDRCRQWLNGALSDALHARGELLPVQALSGSLYSEGFAAKGGALFRLIQADQLHADVRFGILSRSCTVDQLEAARLRLDLAEPFGLGPGAQVPGPAQSASGASKPAHFELRRVVANELELTWSGGRLQQLHATGAPDERISGEWLLNGRDGLLKIGFLPTDLTDWRLESCTLRVHGKAVALTGAQLRGDDHAEVRIEGELMPSEAGCWSRTDFSGIPVGPWLSPDWRARLTGVLSGEIETRPAVGGLRQSGSLSLANGLLTAVPVLDKIAAATGAEGFRQLRIHNASARFKQTGTTWTVTNLNAESDGLVKVIGGFEIRERREIDGQLLVGVAPSVLQWAPGAKERVFTVARDGFLWTTVRLSGPADHPREDLTERLVAAAVTQSVEDIGRTVHDTAKGFFDLVAPLVPEKVPVPTLPGLFP